jgi:hypothetical protein
LYARIPDYFDCAPAEGNFMQGAAGDFVISRSRKRDRGAFFASRVGYHGACIAGWTQVPDTTVVFASDFPVPGLKAPLFRQLFRGLKPPAPSAKDDLQLQQLFRGLKPPAPSAKDDLQLQY